MLQQEKQTGPVWLIQRLKSAEKRQAGSWQVVWNESIAPMSAIGEGGETLSRDFVRSVKTFEQAVKMSEKTFYPTTMNWRN